MLFRFRPFMCGLATAVLFAADPVEWPQYRGTDGSGIAATAGPVQFNLKKNLLWSVELPQGHSSPSISGDRIFLTSFDKTVNKLEVLAVDRKKGKIEWRPPIPATEFEKVHDVSSPATATPIADGNHVYTYFGSAGLFAHDSKGKLLWSVPMPVAKAAFGSGSSPALAGDLLIVSRDDAEERKLIAIDKRTGKEVWNKDLGGTKPGGSGHATPVVWKQQIVLHRQHEIAGYSVGDGSRVWWARLASQGTSTPVVFGDTVYFGAAGFEAELQGHVPDFAALVMKHDSNGDGAVSEDEFPSDLVALRRIDAGSTPGAVVLFKTVFGFIDSNKDKKVVKSEWEDVLKLLDKGSAAPHGTIALRLGGDQDVTKTNVIWSEPRSVPEVPMALVYKDRVYTISNGGIASAYDVKTGKVLFRGRVGAGGLYYASPIAAADRIYFASGDGVVSVIAAGDTLNVLANNDLGEPIFATPAIVEGKLYVRTSGHLYAFNEE